MKQIPIILTQKSLNHESLQATKSTFMNNKVNKIPFHIYFSTKYFDNHTINYATKLLYSTKVFSIKMICVKAYKINTLQQNNVNKFL